MPENPGKSRVISLGVTANCHSTLQRESEGICDEGYWMDSVTLHGRKRAACAWQGEASEQ